VFNEDASKLIRDMIYAFCLSRLFYGILNGRHRITFSLTQNAASSADAMQAVDGNERLYHKRCTLTTRLRGNEKRQD
jgi:hypothetical protein